MRYSIEQIQHICHSYLAGESSRAIANKLGCSPTSIRNLLRANNVPIRPWFGFPKTCGPRNYALNHRFFATIDTEEKAYWLGFLSADGCISDSNTLIVGLSPKDEDHLVRLRTALGANHPLYRKPDGTAAVLAITSVVMARDLAQFGVVPRKTFTIRWPTNLPDNMLRHYARGYVDGDGGFTIWNSKTMFRVTSSREYLLGMQRFLVDTCQLRATRILESSGKGNPLVGDLVYSGWHQVSRLFHFLYDDATIFLPRKKERIEPTLLSHKFRPPYKYKHLK